jgi:hypothetical protein
MSKSTIVWIGVQVTLNQLEIALCLRSFSLYLYITKGIRHTW